MSANSFLKITILAKDNGQIIAKNAFAEELFPHQDNIQKIFSNNLQELTDRFSKKILINQQTLNIYWQKIALSDKQTLLLGEFPLPYLNNAKIYQTVIDSVPIPVFWKDLNFKIIGCNQHYALDAGFASPAEIIGKTDYDLPWRLYADKYIQDDLTVINTEKTLSFEEHNIKPDGNIRHVLVSKSPLYNEEDLLIGVIGTFMDITDKRQAEQLVFEKKIAEKEVVYLKKMAQIEKETSQLKIQHQKKLVSEQEKFVKLANQVAHDIRSPLASLLMMVKSCQQLPENYRVGLREVAIRIEDIANQLLHHYRKQERPQLESAEKQQPLLVSAALLQLLAEKKHQYQDQAIKFAYRFTPDSYFSFIEIQSSAFKRMISNLINNAVEAIQNQTGIVELMLTVNTKLVTITIKDNGIGIPAAIIKKISAKTPSSYNKKNGFGLGLVQVQETLQIANGDLTINSDENSGTEITLTFPKLPSPSWFADNITLIENDILIIVDDDASIHSAWDSRLNPILINYPDLRLHHFTTANETLNFIKHFTEAEKEKIFLLTDYELLKDTINGLEIIEKSLIKRAILVTSHYTNEKVLAKVKSLKTKILPKQLASEIPLSIIPNQNLQTENSRTIEVAIVDDDVNFSESLALFIFDNVETVLYNHPEDFLNKLADFSKTTTFYLDSNFKNSSIRGLDIARKLHAEGFTRLYLLTGEMMPDSELPDYLTFIRKDDIEAIKASYFREYVYS